MDKVYHYIEKSKWIAWVLFGLCFWLAIVHLHLNRGLSDLIPGFHYWRKTDTYAQILNYYHNGLRFFDHGIYFNQMESAGKAVAEFPLFYYLVAIQLKLFGNHVIILKINWLIVMFFGQFALYKTAVHFTKNHILALAVPFSLFLSPVYVIYATEFLPDPIALHFGFIGLYFLVKHHSSTRQKWLVWAVVFITISGMMKPFYFIPFIAYCMVVVWHKLSKKQNLKRHWPLVIPFVLVGLWFLYMSWYNDKNGSAYFLSQLKPFWKYDQVELDNIFNKISVKWLTSYFTPLYLNILLFGGSITLLISFFKDKFQAVFVLLCVLGGFAYFVLLFGMLKNHDYYIFPLLFMAPLISLLIVNRVNATNWHPGITYLLGLVLVFLMYQGMYSSWSERQARLQNKMVNATHEFEPYKHLNHFLNKNNIAANDLVIAFSDKSPSYALMLMNRKGWSGFQTLYRRQKVSDLMDLGAKYMIVNEKLPAKRDSVSLEGVTLDFVADTNQIFIYKLNK